MRTLNRNIADIKTTGLENYTKYFNQMQFDGIMEDDNIYSISQNSFKDCKNVYVDKNNRLVSRPTLQVDNIPEGVIPLSYKLIDIKNVGEYKLYISENTTFTSVTFYYNGIIKNISGLNGYHISVIDRYIICFSHSGAKILDTSDIASGWQNFSDEKFVDIPITKIITGTSEQNFPKNSFTDKYKEQYQYSNTVQPILPLGNPDIKVFSSQPTPLSYSINNINYIDYKIYKEIPFYENVGLNNRAVGYNTTSGKYIIVLDDTAALRISFDGGNTYTTVSCPQYGTYKKGCLTDDATHYCILTNNGIYFCNLGDFTWSVDTVAVDNVTNISGTCVALRAKTRDLYSFVIEELSETSVKLYYKGATLYSGTDINNDNKLGYISQTKTNDYNGWTNHALYDLFYNNNYQTTTNDNLKIFSLKNSENQDINVIVYCSGDRNSNNCNILFLFGGINMYDANSTPAASNSGMLCITRQTSYNNLTIEDLTQTLLLTGDKKFEIRVSGLYNSPSQNNLNHWFKHSINMSLTKNSSGNPTISIGLSTQRLYLNPIYNDRYELWYWLFPPVKLAQGYLYVTCYGYQYYFITFDSQEYEELYHLPRRVQVWNMFATHDKYFIFDTGTGDQELRILTNKLLDNDYATITYTYGNSTNYTEVPNISYSDTELYLGFGNKLSITQNIRDGDDIKFYLGTINDQLFIDNINNIINISTVEIALFFDNKITICSRVQDSNLEQGYRYDYYNTKLSTGVRLGDVVLNTLEGEYTIFPTRRGLAAMNYQAFMATSDQVIKYISDNIKDLWMAFYNYSNNIKLVQWRDKLVLINETNTILIYDLINSAWWKWEIPIKPINVITDQFDLRLINTDLLIFKPAAQYSDFSEIGRSIEIDWYIISQPLHMNAPNYYKNLKQLVFQFTELELPENVVQKTLNAQIKLYRKRVTIREPEIINFKIENLRTFVKRFNYWKINEIQWALSNDNETSTPARFELDGMSVKYELGEEVR